MMQVHINAVGLQTGEFPGWQGAWALLAQGQAPTTTTPRAAPLPFVPTNERRRLTPHIRLALATAADTLELDQAEPSALSRPSIFAHAEGDLDIVDKVCEALTQSARPVSPTHFHNSVHNTASAYWHKALGWHTASTSIAAGEGTFAAGLVEAATQALVERHPAGVLLISSDSTPPADLAAVCDMPGSFGCGLALHHVGSQHSHHTLTLAAVDADEPLSQCATEALETLRRSCPAARALPLLVAMAQQTAQRIVVPWLPEQHLAITLSPQDVTP